MPTILICMENGLKPTVLKKYGMESMFGYPGRGLADKQLPIWDTYVKASYILNRDFVITAAGHNLYVGDNTFSRPEGQKGIWEGQKGVCVHVSEHHTHFIGTCYQIVTNYSIPPPMDAVFSLQFNESIIQADIPPVSIYSIFPTLGSLKTWPCIIKRLTFL